MCLQNKSSHAAPCVSCVSEEVMVKEHQSVSLPGAMASSSAVGMTASMEIPRKRKGCMDNQ